ncbi:unannotated protein [freshwater metagenome]|uniref:Unannotated protein n=1 Tax=freshwater metagenome TaxID=449393 RepID=A0A6J6EIM9_9ZZZZ|nr:hypothetical protein [Actinomycetota bacterium]
MRYGTIDFDYAADLSTREPDADGPVFMVNFMKYRESADYDGVKGAEGATPAGISGEQADDLYNPTEVLHKIGAEVMFFGNVVAQGSEGEWDRMGIVKYATRRSFIDMQNRRDFKEKHVHKEAGMLYTIVMGTTPSATHAPIERANYVVFELTAAPQSGGPDARTARLAVEGTIMGDGRRWGDLTMRWTDEIPAVPARDKGGDSITVVAKISIDRMGKGLTA